MFYAHLKRTAGFPPVRRPLLLAAGVMLGLLFLFGVFALKS
jgi:hypothetical protein